MPRVAGSSLMNAATLSMNWLRVLGNAELSHIDQGVRHQFHAKMSLLNVLNPKKEPLEFIRFCRKFWCVPDLR